MSAGPVSAGPVGAGPVGAGLLQRPAGAGARDGGAPARRAAFRWGWRLFRREWRQQLLILGMLAAAVAATIFGAAVATNTPGSPGEATFGTASSLITLPGADPHLAADIAAIKARFGTVDVIENQSLTTGLVQNVELRAQNPYGPYGGPTIALASGRYPSGPDQVAPTSTVASIYGMHVGGTWHQGGHAWKVTGIAENPSNLLDEFALVAPGQVTAPTQVTILLGTANVPTSALPRGATVAQPQRGSAGISPGTIVLVLAVLGLIFIGLVAVAGFTVMAQRRLRALGMLSALGATERNVRLVMVANGAVVGAAATVIGAAAGFGGWFAYAPSLQTYTAHRIDPLDLPWAVIAAGMVLAVLTAILAARRPARAAARIPVVPALSGRPPAPKTAHRSAAPGTVLLVLGLCLLAFTGGWGGNTGRDKIFLLTGLVACVLGLLLLAPPVTRVLGPIGRHAPVAVRIALRDLARYRARSGSALAAISFAAFLAVIITIVASVRFSNALDYAGPNLGANQLIVYTPYGQYGVPASGPGGNPAAPPSQSAVRAEAARVGALATSLHARSVLALESATKGSPGAGPAATLSQVGTRNNNFTGPLYVATPALLHRYQIRPGQVSPDTDVLTMRPGLAAEPHMELIDGKAPPGSACTPGNCIANPKIQAVGSLPGGTSAPNTVLTMHAVRAAGLQLIPSGWLIQTAQPLTADQVNAARQVALSAGASVETKSGALGLSQISEGATALGIIIALAVLAMTIGLIRSETASDLRTLAATGASGNARRTITGATAGALALLGALLGTAVACAAAIGWARSSLSTTFGNVPVADLVIVIAGLPALAAIGGWLLAGREPPAIARQPLE